MGNFCRTQSQPFPIQIFSLAKPVCGLSPSLAWLWLKTVEMERMELDGGDWRDPHSKVMKKRHVESR